VDIGGSNPADRGKRGTMHRVLVVDQKGVPLSVTIIPGANIHDMNASTIANVTLTNTISVNDAVMALRFNMLALILNVIED
jgi:hypothetical protein